MIQTPFLLDIIRDLSSLLRAFISGGVFENLLQLSLSSCVAASALAFSLAVELGRIDPPFPRAIINCRRPMLLQTLAPVAHTDIGYRVALGAYCSVVPLALRGPLHSIQDHSS